MKPAFRWPWHDRVTNKDIYTLLEKLVGTSISAAQALADLQGAVAQLTTDVQAFIAKSQSPQGVSPADVETVVASLKALDAAVNPPAPPAAPAA